MNRLTLGIIILSLSSSAAAEQLYRWIEPDGSITFSPNPPPKGVDYREVNAEAGNDVDAETLNKISAAEKPASILSTSSIDPVATVPNTAAVQAPVSAAVTKPGLMYAPDTTARATTKAAHSNANAQAADTPTAVNSAAVQNLTVASNKKRERCVELSKRVVSLERRLRSGLTAIDMDNTVVAMARYQRSYDQHCA